MNIIIPIIAGLVVLGLIILLIRFYNNLVMARNRVKNQWSQIDVQLKRRCELIPNLVECVKGFVKHENEIIDRITDARIKMSGARTPKEAMEANNQLNAALPSLFALGEAYPNLKANTNFLQLQNELGGTENKIAHARQFYNDTVLKYTDLITMFPGSIFASIFGFGEEPFFEATEEERKNVQVKF